MLFDYQQNIAPKEPTMNDDPAPHSKRADLRAGRKTRRKQQLALREAVFDMIASRYDYQVIAATLEISVATVRREFDRAIDERRLDAPERYARVQVARLHKALRVVDELVDKGDPKAVAPLIRLVAALDRYHGLAPARPAPETPSPPLALPAPPLALTSPMPRRLLTGSWRTPAKLQIWRTIPLRSRMNPFDGGWRRCGFRRGRFRWRKRIGRGYLDVAAPGVWRKQRE